jgi:hypothetical protein
MAREPFAARLTTIWIGGAFFWLIKGFQSKYYDEIADKYNLRNMIAGYIIQIIALAGLVYFLFIKGHE